MRTLSMTDDEATVRLGGTPWLGHDAGCSKHSRALAGWAECTHTCTHMYTRTRTNTRLNFDSTLWSSGCSSISIVFSL